MKNIPEEIKEKESSSNMSGIFSRDSALRDSALDYDRLNVDIL